MGSYLAEISLAALAIAVVVAIVRNVNVGPLSLAIALVVGYYIGGVKVKTIIAGYPVNVFIMLAGITYLFAIANINGTPQENLPQRSRWRQSLSITNNTSLSRESR